MQLTYTVLIPAEVTPAAFAKALLLTVDSRVWSTSALQRPAQAQRLPGAKRKL